MALNPDLTAKLVKFNRGLEANLPVTSTENAFYLATDTNRLYVGKENKKPVLLNSAIRVYDTIKTLLNSTAEKPSLGDGKPDDGQYKPAEGDIAFVKDESILAMYIGSSWVQVNPDTKYDSDIQSINTALANCAKLNEENTFIAKNTFKGDVNFEKVVTGVTPGSTASGNSLATKDYVDSAVAGLEDGTYVTDEELAEAISTVNQSIVDLDSAIDGVEKTANAAKNAIGTLPQNKTVVSYIEEVKATADAAMPKAGGNFTGDIYRQKNVTVDGQSTTKNYKYITEEELTATNANITSLNETLTQVKNTADAAMPKSGGIFTNVVSGVDPTADAHLATKNYVDTRDEAVKTALRNGATNLTTFKAVEEKFTTELTTIDNRFDEIEENVSNLANVMDFVGVTTDDLSDGSTKKPIKINGIDYTPKSGDVVLSNGEEFVWDETAWHAFGFAHASDTAIADLQSKVQTNTNNISTNSDAIEELKGADNTLNTAIENNATDIQTLLSLLTWSDFPTQSNA